MSIIKRMLLISLLFSLTVWADEGWQVKLNSPPEYGYTAYVLRGDGNPNIDLEINCFPSEINFTLYKPVSSPKVEYIQNQKIEIIFTEQDNVAIPVSVVTHWGEAILWMGRRVMQRRSIEYMENEQDQRQVIKFLEQLYRTEPNQTLIFKLPGLDGEIITSEFSAKGAKNALLQFTEVCPGFALPVKLSTMPIPEAYQTEDLDE